MDSNNKADSRKILGIETITAFIETEIDPSNLMGIVESENFLEGILDNYLEITSTENTELMSIDDVFELLGKGQPILIRDNSKSDIKNLLAIVETIRAINKKVTRLNTEFDSKLIIDLSNPDNAVWEKLSTFINQKFNSFTNYKLIQNQQIQQKLNHWISETIKKAHLKLEKSLKDFLHSEVNKSIILNKITGTEGWKFKLNDEKKHKSDPLKQYETAIRDEINTLITPYKAPFIEQFSKELFSRCYKQLLSSEKESIMPSKIKTDIQDITQTQLNNLKLEANVKQRFNKEYNDLLKYLLSNKSDIKQYAKNKLSILKSISNDAELSEKEKKDIQSTFFQIYHNIRGYEQENHYWAENAQHLGDSKKGAKERFLFQALEASIHRFRPYVLSRFNQLKTNLFSSDLTERKTLLQDYESIITQVQKMTETLDLVRLINKSNINLEDIVKQQSGDIQQSIDALIGFAIAPWQEFDWHSFLIKTCNALNLSRNIIQSNQRSIREFRPPQTETTSTMVANSPKIQPSPTSNLNNRI